MTVNFYETHDELVSILYTELFAIYIVALSFALFTKNSHHFHGIGKLRTSLWILAVAMTTILVNNVYYDDPTLFFIGHVLTVVGNVLILIGILDLHLAKEKLLVKGVIAISVLLVCYFFYFTFIEFSFQNIALMFHLKRLIYVLPLIYVLHKYRIKKIKENYFWLQLFLFVIALFSLLLSYKIFYASSADIFQEAYLNNELLFDIIDFSYLGFYVGIVYLLYSHASILIQELADYDALTKVYNRRAFLNRARQYKSVYTLAFFDIDYFKKINDLYGHDAGDEALKHLSSHLKEHFKNRAIIGRFGGEEFVIFMENTPLNDTKIVCEAFRKRIKESVINYQNSTITLTVSCGIASGKSGDSLEETIKKADASMYEAKENGRNQIVISTL